jgi:hypothetical protein
MQQTTIHLPVVVAERSEAWTVARSEAVIASLNPALDMNV